MHMHTHIDKSYIQQPLGHGCPRIVSLTAHLSLFGSKTPLCPPQLGHSPAWLGIVMMGMFYIFSNSDMPREGLI